MFWPTELASIDDKDGVRKPEEGLDEAVVVVGGCVLEVDCNGKDVVYGSLVPSLLSTPGSGKRILEATLSVLSPLNPVE